jgi:hypothetical protein
MAAQSFFPSLPASFCAKPLMAGIAINASTNTVARMVSLSVVASLIPFQTKKKEPHNLH